MNAVHRIKLPFHLELDHVNVFLVRDGGGWILVDAGFGSGESFAALEAGLDSHGVRWPDIHTLLITHCHPDHIGLAQRIVDHSGARLLMHAAEKDFLEYIADVVDRPEALDNRMLEWGAPPELVSRISRSFRAVRQNFRHLTPDALLQGGERIGPFETIWTPGHAPGHLCLYLPQERALISGDHVLSKITPHVAWVEGRDVLADYLESLQRVATLDAATVHPSHGDEFTHLAERTREIARHHQWRCQTIRQAIEDGARTAHQVVERLWQRRLSPFQHRFALFEVMAHIEHMRRRGEDLPGFGPAPA